MRAPLLPLLALTTASACLAQPNEGPAPKSPTPSYTAGVVRVDTVATGLEHPWAVAQMPDGRFLVTERPGRLRLVDQKGVISAPIAGVPAVHAVGQGGLLDVTLAPDFATSKTLYLSFSEPGEGGTAGTAVARAQLGERKLENVQVIYRQVPKMRGGGHYGSRVVVARDGNLFITQGDRMLWRDSAQSMTAGLGKIARVKPDGSIPADNPFVKTAGARPEIWSLGHRNLQGGALDPATGQLWTVEHGARGGDELNHPEAGKNYGWPVITYGMDYSGAKIGVGAVKEGMEQPVYYWDPVIAASGLTFYTGDKYPGWKGSVFVGSMTPGGLVRLEVSGGKVVKEERYLGELKAKRVRDVVQGVDGFLYVVTDHDEGSLLRVVGVK
ncbi:MAG: PQQ-dependent sugar dehydrogenase [Gemmatimonadaceae bacterium]|nr:PQQ-dependent sugar dehydrogenase [Gemmatimonadaceae bacterium]